MVLSNDAIDDGEAEPRAAPDVLRGEEGLERSTANALVHAHAVVRNAHRDVLLGLLFARHRGGDVPCGDRVNAHTNPSTLLPTALAGFARIDEQVGHGLLDERR